VFRSLLTLLALALAVAACDREAGPAAQQEEKSAPAKQELSGEIDRSKAGTLLPALLLSDPAGRQINLGAVQGTPVLVNPVGDMVRTLRGGDAYVGQSG